MRTYYLEIQSKDPCSEKKNMFYRKKKKKYDKKYPIFKKVLYFNAVYANFSRIKHYVALQ